VDALASTRPRTATLQLMDVAGISLWAHEQGTVFWYAQAQAAGHSRRSVERAVREGLLRDLGRGALVSQEIWQAADKRGRHRILVAARLLQLDSRWMAARRSAAVFHDLPLLGDPPARAQLVRSPEGAKVKAKSRHERIATVDPAERTEVAGVAVAGLARTVVDLAREEPFRNGLIAADGALRRGLDHAELLALAKLRVDWPGGLTALRVAKLANGLHETPLESLSWAAAVSLGIPLPEPQVQVYLGDVLLARVDGIWRDRNTIGQADGLFKYKDRQGVIKDKLQDEALEDVGFEVVRWGWADAWHPEGVLDARLMRAFERGRRQSIDPRVSLVPTTLEQSLEWTGLIAS
jgi:hypothetical protein